MSRQVDPHKLFATQTAFSALDVETGEDISEEEVIEEPGET
jgi:hypothetical protein